VADTNMSLILTAPTQLTLERVKSPLGEIFIASKNGAICNLEFADTEERMQKLLARHFGEVESLPAKSGEFAKALHAYFDGDVQILDTLPVKTNGTLYQERAWAALRRIPAGETRSYGEQARDIGDPNGARAVGLANHLNPVGIVVPCHRVIGADGSLTGYAGGLDRKRWLLEHEAKHTSLPLFRNAAIEKKPR
jgi:methylated-DNA-[protein]-cysteine S-methyltransferase